MFPILLCYLKLVFIFQFVFLPIFLPFVHIGGAAGAASRITGTLGKGIAALTLDKDYQRKRRQNISRRPQDFTHGIAQSGKGLFMVCFVFHNMQSGLLFCLYIYAMKVKGTVLPNYIFFYWI